MLNTPTSDTECLQCDGVGYEHFNGIYRRDEVGDPIPCPNPRCIGGRVYSAEHYGGPSVDDLIAEILEIDVHQHEAHQQPIATKADQKRTLTNYLHEIDMRRLMRPGG